MIYVKAFLKFLVGIFVLLFGATAIAGGVAGVCYLVRETMRAFDYVPSNPQVLCVVALVGLYMRFGHKLRPAPKLTPKKKDTW